MLPTCLWLHDAPVEEGLDECSGGELIEAARAAGIVLLSASVQRNRL